MGKVVYRLNSRVAPEVSMIDTPVPATFLNQSSFTTGQGLEGMYVSADGSYLFTAHGDLGYTQGKIEQYTLSTSWDITTGTFVRSYTLTTGINFTYATGVEFKPDGKVMYVSGLTSSGYKVASYNLSTAWNIATKSSTQVDSVNLFDLTGEDWFLGFSFTRVD